MKVSHLARFIVLLALFAVTSVGQTTNEASKGKRVLLNVTVLDMYDEPINDLKIENFRLFEDKKPLVIERFESADSPVSVGILFDASRSMNNLTDVSREAMLAFIEESNPQNEYFVTAFGTQVDVLSEFTGADNATKIIADSPYFAKSRKKGETVLYDAIISGIEKLSKAKNQKKVLFVFWDIDENYTSGRYKELEKLVKEKNIILFLTGYNGFASRTPLGDLAERTGGASFYSEYGVGGFFDNQRWIFYRSKYYSPREMFFMRYEKIARRLKNLYTLSFEPGADDGKNKWRNLEVKLEIEKEIRKKAGSTEALFRKGYYPLSELVVSN